MSAFWRLIGHTVSIAVRDTFQLSYKLTDAKGRGGNITKIIRRMGGRRLREWGGCLCLKPWFSCQEIECVLLLEQSFSFFSTSSWYQCQTSGTFVPFRLWDDVTFSSNCTVYSSFSHFYLLAYCMTLSRCCICCRKSCLFMFHVTDFLFLCLCVFFFDFIPALNARLHASVPLWCRLTYRLTPVDLFYMFA